MIKLIHIIFIFTAFVSFIGRFSLSFLKPDIVQNKIAKIVPHVIDTILLLSGFSLVIQGNWLEGEYGWIISKLILLLGYIAFGIMAMRCKGSKRWLAFFAAIACFVYIFIIAVTKQGYI
jgi:uncharacterized membrane protein SirB2